MERLRIGSATLLCHGSVALMHALGQGLKLGIGRVLGGDLTHQAGNFLELIGGGQELCSGRQSPHLIQVLGLHAHGLAFGDGAFQNCLEAR